MSITFTFEHTCCTCQQNSAKYKKKQGGSVRLKIAEVGNIIEFREGLRGIVEKVNENSVIVDLTYMENYRELDLEEKTVINHKNYKVIKESINI